MHAEPYPHVSSPASCMAARTPCRTVPYHGSSHGPPFPRPLNLPIPNSAELCTLCQTIVLSFLNALRDQRVQRPLAELCCSVVNPHPLAPCPPPHLVPPVAVARRGRVGGRQAVVGAAPLPHVVAADGSRQRRRHRLLERAARGGAARLLNVDKQDCACKGWRAGGQGDGPEGSKNSTGREVGSSLYAPH